MTRHSKIRYNQIMRKFPVEIDRSSPLGLAEQVVKGVKDAIRTGRYREGDRLPTWREMAKTLGVSQRIPREAIAQLVRDGFVVSRPRLGCTVAADVARRREWKGVVLVVQSRNESESYSSLCMFNAMERILARAGFAVIRTNVEHRAGKHTPYDLTMADRILSFKIDFVVIEGSSRQLQRWIESHHVPYLSFSNTWGCAALDESILGNHLRLDFSTAIKDFVGHCRRANVRRVLQVSFAYPEMFDAIPDLSAVGIGSERWTVPCERDPTPNQVTAAGMKAFSDRLRKNRDWLPDVLLFTDDYLAIGGVMALMHAGVRIPGEVRVVTFANVGNEPVLAFSPACIVADCARLGEAIARTILQNAGKKLRSTNGGNPVYMPGESFPLC